MKSNGYGRLIQQIILQVEQRHRDVVAAKLGVKAFKEDGEHKQAFFAWSRLTTRPGNDEDVVWDLSVLLGVASDRFNWQVDWEASDY